MVLKVCSLDIQLWAIEFILSAHEKKTDQLFCLLYLYNPKLKPVGMIYEYSRRPPSVLQEKEVTDKTSLEKDGQLTCGFVQLSSLVVFVHLRV